MGNRIRSGIYFDASAMRYAEIEHTESGRRLLRLGSCDFEFDSAAAVYEGQSERSGTIREALADVFSGTQSKHFTVVVSPAEAVAFYSPLSAGVEDEDRFAHLEGEARLVSGGAEAVAVTADRVATEVYEREEIAWHHVAAMPNERWERIVSVLSVFEGANYRYITRLQSAAGIAECASTAVLDSGRFRVIVGRFESLTEIGVVGDSGMRSSNISAVTDPSDILYQILAQLADCGVAQSDVAEVMLYGHEDVSLAERLRDLTSVERLDPLAVVSNGPSGGNFDPGLYAFCMGGAL